MMAYRLLLLHLAYTGSRGLHWHCQWQPGPTLAAVTFTGSQGSLALAQFTCFSSCPAH